LPSGVRPGTLAVVSIDLQLGPLRESYRSGALSPERVLRDRHARAIAEAGRHAFIELLPLEKVLAQLEEAEGRRARGESLPLFGVPFAVKDNIDVAGVPTTAACSAYAYTPRESAPAVEALQRAGAICFGKTNMDQFATGLVGTRSPFGVCGSVFDERQVSGGSSSGSALVVALGLVSFALGTDTAGSGRVPAAFNNIVGLKPTKGLISTRGVVPACRSLDTVSIFAANVADSLELLHLVQGFDAADPFSRHATDHPPFSGSGEFCFGVPFDEQLEFFGDEESRALFQRATETFQALGGVIHRVDLAPFLAAAGLLYTGPWVAERYAAVGEFMESLDARGAGTLDPTVADIVLSGKTWTGVDAFRGHYELARLKRATAPTWAEVDVMLLPTVPRSYSVEEVRAEPLQLNANLGRYTNFVNLLDLCGVAVPAGIKPSGLPFGVTLLAPAFHEEGVARLAARFHDRVPSTVGATSSAVRPWTESAAPSDFIELVVVGAHLRGQPLHHQLTELGARFLGEATTSSRYRLFALDTTPKKPGLVRSASSGGAIALERYALSFEAFGRFVAQVPHPLTIGTVELADGRWVKGFLCEPIATDATKDITDTGGWLRYLSSL
jgi:allophanate hydrolase